MGPLGKVKKKTRNPGVGVDFKRVKHKVGKKLPKARNETDTDFTSRTINLPSQAVREDRSGVAVNYQNLTLKELLNQTSHHNDKARKHSLAGLADLFGRHPEQLRLHASQVLGTLAERIVDGDSGVRSALRSLLNDGVLPVLGPEALRPFMPVIMAHVCGAMTHLSLDVRNDALLFLDVMMDHAPQLVVDGYLAACLAHFCDLFSSAHRGRSIRAQSLAALTKLLTALTSFLRRAFPEPATLTAAERPSGQPSHLAATATGEGGAGPGPSSIRQQQQQQHSGRGFGRDVVGDSTAGSWDLATLGADRARPPLRTARELLASLDDLFRAAAAVTRTARKVRGGKAAAADATADKNRHKKGRGSVSTTEAAPSPQLGAGAAAAAAPSGGKAVAAAAAALAAVTAPAAAAAAGVDLTAPSGSMAAGLLGAGTSMAAALAAAADSRASALRLVSLLMDCWLECAPAQLATAPELEQAAALAMIATACNTLVQRLVLPAAEGPQHGAQCGVGAAPQQQGPPRGPLSVPQSQQHQAALMQQVHEVVARRVATHFPAAMPPVKPSVAVVEALVRLNLQTAELLCRFLPLVRSGPLAAASAVAAAGGDIASAPAAMPWVPALVSFYVDVLERGVLVPAAAGTLADAPVAPSGGAGPVAAAAGGQGLPAGASDAVLAAVSSAVQELQGDAAAAQRLMAAVAEFASRQSARSAARLACIRMQHGLLKAALAGRMFLEDGVVAGWLSALPKLLWEAGASAPDVSAAALALLLDAARFTAPGSSMSSYLATTLQPQLAPLFAVQLPAKAAKAAIAKHLAAAQAGRGTGGAAAAAPAGSPSGGLDPDAVLVLLPGVVHKLPEPVAALLVDLVYHTGPLGAALLKPLAATLSSTALQPALALRLLGVVLARLREAADPALAASWLLTLLFGPQHGHTVLSPEGADLSLGWDRQQALVAAAARGLGALGGAGPLLAVLAPQLAGLPLSEAGTVGARAARLQRHSFVTLCAFAAGELAPARGGGGGFALPQELREALPAALALSGLELGVAAMDREAAAMAAGPGAAAATSASDPLHAGGRAAAVYGPVMQVLSEAPVQTAPVLGRLTVALQGGGAVGCLPPHTAALAALRLAQAVVKLPAVRGALAAAGAEREVLVAAAKGLVAAARALPVATGGTDMEHAAACVAEGKRLAQTLADMYGAES